MKTFPFATSGDPIRRHVSADWINTLNAILIPDDAPPPGDGSGGGASPRLALVRVDSNLSGGGLYRGKFSPIINRAASAAANTAAAVWMDTDNLADCVVVNWGDAGGSSHSLSAGQVMPAVKYGSVDVSGVLLPAYHVGGVGGSLPEAEYQFMVWQMVSDNQAGWDFVRAHPIL